MQIAKLACPGAQSTKSQRVWVLIDEAHQFVPSGKTTLAKEALIRWTKEGRQPGLSLAVASQQPSAIDSEVITRCLDAFTPTRQPVGPVICPLSRNRVK